MQLPADQILFVFLFATGSVTDSSSGTFFLFKKLIIVDCAPFCDIMVESEINKYKCPNCSFLSINKWHIWSNVNYCNAYCINPDHFGRGGWPFGLNIPAVCPIGYFKSIMAAELSNTKLNPRCESFKCSSWSPHASKSTPTWNNKGINHPIGLVTCIMYALYPVQGQLLSEMNG